MILFWLCGSYWVESYSVGKDGQNIFPSAGRKYDVHISRVASENTLLPTQNISLCASIYGKHMHTDRYKQYVYLPTCKFTLFGVCGLIHPYASWVGSMSWSTVHRCCHLMLCLWLQLWRFRDGWRQFLNGRSEKINVQQEMKPSLTPKWK